MLKTTPVGSSFPNSSLLAPFSLPSAAATLCARWWEGPKELERGGESVRASPQAFLRTFAVILRPYTFSHLRLL